MAWPTSRLSIKTELAFGADPLGDPSLWSWTDVSVYARDDFTIRRGANSRDQEAQASVCEFALKNADGRFTPNLPTSPYYPNVHLDVPVRISVDPGTGYNVRFVGFISKMALTWPSGRTGYSELKIEAQGLLRRLDKSKRLNSAAYRALIALNPVAYWPCEDTGSAATLMSAVGGPGATFHAGGTVSLASDSNIDGSAPLLKVSTTSAVEFPLRPFSSSTEWMVGFMARLPNDFTTDETALITIRTPGGTADTWDLRVRTGSPDKIQLEAYVAGGGDLLGGTAVNFIPTTLVPVSYVGLQLWFEIHCKQNGTGIDWDFTCYSTVGSSGGSGTKASATLTPVRSFSLNGPLGVRSDLNGATFGHFVCLNGSTTGVGAKLATGWSGELASTRFTRLCAEEGIQSAVDTSSLVDFAMGPQNSVKFVDLLREIEDSDQGTIRETRTAASLTYRTRGARYNRAVDLALDFNLGNVQTVFQPLYDDQEVANDWTVTRSGGGSTNYAVNDGTLGTYPGSSTVNVDTDVGLVHHAEWQVHLGTSAAQQGRTPALQWNLKRSSSLVASWLACDLGSRITAAHPPSQYPPDTLDLLLVGYQEMFSQTNWEIVANTADYRPYEVFKIEDTRLGRLDTDGSALNAAMTSGATSVTVAPTTTKGPKWTTDSGDRPFDIAVAGERMTVTNVVDASKSFINAGTAASANNASVTPGLPASIAAGDLLLIWAAIRAQTGTVNTPTGYTKLLDCTNACLFGKIASSSEVAPTVSFNGGASGDDTTAQMAAFRNVGLSVAYSASQLNVLAQNISYPELGIITANCLVLYLGWKQDDWTSVATIAGATEIGEPVSTVGNDHGLVWDYLLQTTATSIPAGAFVVTGGLTANSRGAVVAIRGDVQTLTVTRSVNGVVKAQTAGTAVNIWRGGAMAL